MDTVKLEPDSDIEVLPSHSKDLKEGNVVSESFTFTRGHSDIKMEPEGDVDPEPDGAMDPEPEGVLDPESDSEIDSLDLKTAEEIDSVLEQDELPYPLAFLAVESKVEDGTWDGTLTPTVKGEIERETHNEDFGVHLEELDEVSKEPWKGCVDIQSKRRISIRDEHRNKTERIERKKEQNRLSKRRCRAAKTEEELRSLREKDRLRKRMVLASQTSEELERRREKDRLRKRKAKALEKQQIWDWTSQVTTNKDQDELSEEVKSHLVSDFMQQSELWDSVSMFAELERQREQNRLRKRKSLASQTTEEVERRREKDRVRKRKFLACQTPEEIAVRREKDRLRKKKIKELERHLEQELMHQTDFEHSTAILLGLEQFERQRERNRLNKRRSLASQTPEQAESRREKDRLRKRKAREIVKQNESSS